MAFLAYTGKTDNQLSDFLVNGFNNAVSLSLNAVIQKIVCLISVV